MPNLWSYILLTALTISTANEVVAEQLPQDFVDGVALISMMNRELKAECEKRFPDLRDQVNIAFESISVNQISIREHINGREYRNPMTHSMLVVMREMTKGREYGAVKRKDCENARDNFEKPISQLIGKREEKDFKALLDWAADGKRMTQEEKGPVQPDMEIVQRMQKQDFWNSYPSEIRDRSLLGINLVRYIQRAQYVAREIKTICNKKWPEGATTREGAYLSWPFSSVEAVTMVNGRPYDNPFIYPAAHQYWIPQLYGKDEQQQETSCKDFSATLDRITKRAELRWFPILVDLLTIPR